MALFIDKTQAEKYLTINMIDSSPSLANHLPLELAKIFHAIPIADDQRNLKVAIANPENPAARQAIRSAVTLPVTVVKSELEAIDSLIAKCYGSAPLNPINILAWVREDPVPSDQEVYLNNLVKVLNAWLSRMGMGEDLTSRFPVLRENIKHLEIDLLVCSSRTGPFLQHLVGILEEKKLLQRWPFSILSTKNSRWPIRQILLVLQGSPVGCYAEDWAVRLEIACQASLTILPVVPPAMYAVHQDDIMNLLTSNCRLGRHLRWIAHRLASWEIPGKFKLRVDTTECQIRSEIIEGDFDLIIIGAEPQNLAQGLIPHDLVSPLLCWTTNPVLLVQTYPQGK